MELTHNRVDLAACAADGAAPHDVIVRKPADIWLVPHEPVFLDRPVVWCRQSKANHVLIPLIPYLVPPEPDLALGFMLQLGMRCAFEYNAAVLRLHIATGYPVNQISDGTGAAAWQYYIGFGIVLESQTRSPCAGITNSFTR